MELIITGSILFLVAFIVLSVIAKVKTEIKLAKSNIADVDKMSGIEFEEFLRVIFKRLNYRAEVTKASGDFGADLILRKDDKKIIVQAKRYKNKVPIKAIQEIVGAKAYYEADEIWAVTNSYFTEPAVKLARANQVQLIEREKLIDLILKSQQANKNA